MLAYAIERIEHLKRSHERVAMEEVDALHHILDDVREGFEAVPDMTTKTDRARLMVATHYLKLLQMRVTAPLVHAPPPQPKAVAVAAAVDRDSASEDAEDDANIPYNFPAHNNRVNDDADDENEVESSSADE
jgi:hypothetical protein